MLLIMLMAIPLIGALIILITRDKFKNIAFLVSLLVLVLAIFGLKDVFLGMPLTYEIVMSGPFKIAFQIDGLSAIFVLLAAFLWTVVSIYSPRYMEHEGKAWIFQLSTLLTLFAVIGVFLARNLLTMLLFFELMTISSYFLVIHRWDKDAIKAGYFYLFYSIVGGLLVALAIVMMNASTDTLPLIGSTVLKPINPKIFAWSIAIFLVAFGIKAGVVPLHLWLPYAYSASPTPASALLSGLITKVGVYGLIRAGGFVGWGINIGSGMTWLSTGLIILGTVTMLLGVMAALIQSDAKKLLAYHSISQMGYIILGLGVSLYLGSKGGLGLSGAIYHIINHALFKASLFLGVGIIYLKTGENDLYKMGGLWRSFPVTAILMLVAVLGITGAPGFNGYPSKSLLHHAITLAAVNGTSWLVWVERLFLIVGVGTAASFSKLYYLMFLGKPGKAELSDKGSPKLQLAMVLISVLILVIGIRPELLLNIAIVPAVRALGIEGIAETLSEISFWHFGDILDMIITLSLGLVVCFAGFKTGAFHWNPPVWLTIEGIVKLLVSKILVIWKILSGFYHTMEEGIQNIVRASNSRFQSTWHKFDQSKSANLLGMELMGVSADIAILFFTLAFIIALYTLINII